MSDHQEEQEITLGDIDAALGALVKAAEATDLVKGANGIAIDQGGHTDERGSTGGGYAGRGDFGGIDPMMIGKMESALVDAGFSADAIAAFMSKKGEEEEEEEEEVGKSQDAHTAPRQPAEDPMQKALASFADSEAIADAVDVSPFMEDFVAKSAALYGDLVKSVREGQQLTDGKLRHMAAATYGLGQMLKSITQVTEALNGRLSLVERTPNAPKGARTLTGAQAMHKSLPREVGTAPQASGPGAAAPQQLTKSEIASTLSYMNLEKGMKEIGGHKTSELIGMLEAGNQLHPVAATGVQRFLAANPHEAETARRYH